MKFINQLLATILLFGGLTACSSVSVSTDYDPAIDFAEYNTFALGKRDRPNDVLALDQLVQNRVYNAITNTMQEKGFELVTSDPQLTVFTHAVTQAKSRVYSDPTYMGYGYGRWGRRGGYGWSGGDVRVQNYTEGSLIIDIVDTATHKMVWRGVGSAVLGESSTPEEKTEKINQAITEILADFPPKQQ